MGGQDDDWTLVNHDQVPQVRNNRKGKNKDGKKNRKDGGKDIEMVEKTSKKGQIVHQTVRFTFNSQFHIHCRLGEIPLWFPPSPLLPFFAWW